MDGLKKQIIWIAPLHQKFGLAQEFQCYVTFIFSFVDQKFSFKCCLIKVVTSFMTLSLHS